MIEVRKMKYNDAYQRNKAIKYVVTIGDKASYLTEKALIELQSKLNDIGIVSQQRELLLDFLKEQEYCGLVEILEDNFEHYVDEYLKDK